MVKLNLSTKRMKIDKANALMVSVIAGASFLVIFSAVASNQLLSQRAYQARVITEKEEANDTLKKNVESVKSLAKSYREFVERPINVIGGLSVGDHEKDGDNARIVLDALPSKYDFPATMNSMTQLLTSKNFKMNFTHGEDDEINQQKQTGSSNPEPVEIPISVEVKGDYSAMILAIQTINQSIRPIPIYKMTLAGNDAALKMELETKTFYLPEKTLEIKSKVVK